MLMDGSGDEIPNTDSHREYTDRESMKRPLDPEALTQEPQGYIFYSYLCRNAAMWLAIILI